MAYRVTVKVEKLLNAGLRAVRGQEPQAQTELLVAVNADSVGDALERAGGQLSAEAQYRELLEHRAREAKEAAREAKKSNAFAEVDEEEEEDDLP